MLNTNTFRFGLVIWAGLCVMLAPSANADSAQGTGATSGTSVDSSTSAGDSFVPIEAVVIPKPVSAQIEVNVRTGEITTSPELLSVVNTEAVAIVTQLRRGQVNSATFNGDDILPPNTQEAIVNLLIADATTQSPQIDALTSAISLAGVSSEAGQSLLSALAGMCKCSLNSDSSSAVSTNGVLPQCGEIAVDLNKLSDAIIAYNDIVMSSNPDDLQLLANDPEFLVIGQLLREIREPLKSSSS